jgi:hypothetical protein
MGAFPGRKKIGVIVNPYPLRCNYYSPAFLRVGGARLVTIFPQTAIFGMRIPRSDDPDKWFFMGQQEFRPARDKGIRISKKRSPKNVVRFTTIGVPCGAGSKIIHNTPMYQTII